MRPGVDIVALAAAMLAALVAPATATPVLDQSYTASTGSPTGITDGSGFQRAMTFTVGIGGDLTSVEVAVTGGTLSLDILSTSGGVPTETVLATGTFESVSGGFSVFSTSLSVTAGEVLALEPICGDTSCSNDLWAASVPNTYAGGQSFLVSPAAGINSFESEFAATGTSRGEDFQTFVNPSTTSVPEPLTVSLFGAGLVGIAALGTRRKHKR